MIEAFQPFAPPSSVRGFSAFFVWLFQNRLRSTPRATVLLNSSAFLPPAENRLEMENRLRRTPCEGIIYPYGYSVLAPGKWAGGENLDKREKLQDIIKRNCNFCSADFFKELLPEENLESKTKNLGKLTVIDLLRLITTAVEADLGYEDGAVIADVVKATMEELQFDFFGCKPFRICDKHF